MAEGDFASERRAECPSCGAPIAFLLGSSRAAVCGFCRFSVVRSDRDLSLLGKVADLVPTAAPIAVGDEGAIGGRAFRVLGRMQLDHGRGPWDEWYVAFADQSWGWLARAEGVWYQTFARDCEAPPAWEALAPGTETTLAGTGTVRWTVAERGGSAVLSAEGELPFPVDPRGSGRYVDLEGDEGAFATLDYGDGTEPPQLFSGRALRADALTLRKKALGPRPVEKVAVQKLACPICGAPIAIFVPSETQRCACAACGSVLDHQAGALSLLMQLERPTIAPLIPLGSEGMLRDARWVAVGFMQRHVRVDGETYAFREYLLHGDGGYAWLVEENHHWLFVTPLSASAVKAQLGMATHAGVAYRAFAKGEPEVDFVVGEFYWKVMRGDRAETVDYVAPPRMLSMERTDTEVSWSAGTYVTPREVAGAFGLKSLPTPTGIAPAQPNPHARSGGTKALALLVFLWFLLAFAYEFGNRKEVLMDTGLTLAGARGDESKPLAFSAPFTITKTSTIEVSLTSDIENGWVQAEAALVPEDGGEPRELSVLVEHYQGFSDGENWSEGSDRADGYFGSVAPGRYSLRIGASWEPYGVTSSYAATPSAQLKARSGVRSAWCSLATLALLVLPLVLRWVRWFQFEAKRNAESSV
ncbi:MAG: DUF4178 domain-containing protein [Polyangiales bacterium]